MADEIDALPVADDKTFPKLLALRTSSARYVGGTSLLAPMLGLQFARAAIPDEALQKLDFKDIFAYRNKTQDLYRAWNIELNKASAKISEADLAQPNDSIQKIIAAELAPKITEYENEMAHIRDQLFGSLIKSITAWELPTLSLSYIANLGYAGAIAAFAAVVRATVPHLVDYVNSLRDTKRKHAVSYLVGLTRAR